jgi:hypothetical protein
MKSEQLSAMLKIVRTGVCPDRTKEADMINNYTHLSGEIRHLAFRKETEYATWHDAIKQQRVTDIENRLGKLTNYKSLTDMAKALVFQFNQWRRTHRQATGLVTNFPSQPKAG